MKNLPQGFEIELHEGSEVLCWKWNEEQNMSLAVFSLIWVISFIFLLSQLINNGFPIEGLFVAVIHIVITILLLHEFLSQLLNKTTFTVIKNELLISTKPLGANLSLRANSIGKLKLSIKHRMEQPPLYGIETAKENLNIWFKEERRAAFVRDYIQTNLRKENIKKKRER